MKAITSHVKYRFGKSRFPRRTILLTALLGLTQASPGAAITLVTGDTARDADPQSYLESQGHSVSTGTFGNIDENSADFDLLNTSDLVIISRNTTSGNYASSAAEVAAWDSLTVPTLLGNAYLTGTNRWSYVNSGGVGEVDYGFDISAPPGTAGVHPFFNGLTPNSAGDPAISGMDKYTFSSSSDLGGTGGVMGDGITIAVRNNVDSQNLALASWQAGEVTGSGNTLGGDRYFYAMAEDFANFDANGEQILNNIVTTAIPEPSSSLLFASALLGFAARRRR